MALKIEGYTYITHKLINRTWGPECRYTVARLDGEHINDVIAIPSMDISNDDLIALVSDRLAHMKAGWDLEASLIKVFSSYGREIQEAVFWLIRQIRQYPNATYAQAETAWNAAWADNLFTFAKLATFVQQKVGNVTWAQFKTYVINHIFEGLD